MPAPSKLRHPDIWNDLQDRISGHLANIRLDMLVDKNQSMPAFPLVNEYPLNLSSQ